MFLSRLYLNPKSRAVRADLADCRSMHCRVMSAFPRVPEGTARSALRVLYRVDLEPRTGRIALLVQSAKCPDWCRLPDGYLCEDADCVENPALKPVGERYASLGRGARLAFRLAANPTRKVDTKSGANGERRNGRRVPLWGEESQIDWLGRKGLEGGFRLLSARARPGRGGGLLAPSGRVVGDLEAGKRGGLTFGAVLFEGVLEVTDPVAFAKSLVEGIGPGKAYGFGLLSIAPLRE